MPDNPDPARRAALDLLSSVAVRQRTLAEAIPRALSGLDAGDRARAQRLATETLRWADRADRMLGPYLRLKPAGPVLNLLRLGVVEICQMGEAPHGVVNDLVELAGSKGPKRLANAVLRKIAGDAGRWASLPLPRLPKWLRKRLLAHYGKDTVLAMEAAHARAAPVDLTVIADPADWARRLGGTVLPTGSVRMAAGFEVTRADGFAGGAWWVQDAAAALPARCLGDVRGLRALDICAAPGGKTMQMAAAGADVTALDISEKRMVRLGENLKRTGLGAQIVVRDALDFDAEPFDVVLLDAPCTATGTIRRHPDMPFVRDETALADMMPLQARLMDKAISLLRPGGRLVYCTCSLLPEEGEDQVRAALDRHPDVELQGCSLPGVGDEWAVASGLRTRPDYWPALGGLDGFFVALMKKRKSETVIE